MTGDGWKTESLDDVAALNPPSDSIGGDEVVSFVPMAAVEAESGRLSPGEPMRLSELRRGLRPFREGDVLFAKITPSMENGKSAVARGLHGGRGFGSTEFHVIRPGPTIDANYLRYFLARRSFRQEARRHMSGTAGQLRVPATYLAGVRVPLPPISVQQQVVRAIEQQLDRVSAAMHAIKRARKNVKRFRRTVLLAAATGRLSHESPTILQDSDLEDLRSPAPLGWREVTLDELTEPGRPICYGILKPRVHDSGVVPYVEVRDLGRGPLDAARLNRTSTALAQEYLRSTLRPGDVLVAVRGSYDRVGIVPPELDGANLSRDVARVSVRGDVDPRYVALYLSSPPVQSYFSRVARGVAVKGVNIGDLRKTPVRLPPIGVQKVIVEQAERSLTQIEHLDREVSRSIARARSLQDAVLVAAFSGHLRGGELPA